MNKCPLCNIDRETNKTFVERYSRWTILINYKQPTLGSNLIVLNRHVQQLSDLTQEEAIEYLDIIKNLERALKESFNPDTINHLMLANVVRHVHYHIVPRYEEERRFAGQTWEDKNYGCFPKLDTLEKDERTLIKIIQEILIHL